MSTLKSVGNKLFKTELATQKIELGVADNAFKALDSFRDREFQKASDLQDSLISQIKDYNKKVNLAYSKFKSIEKGEYLIAYKKITEMAKELGIALNDIPDFEVLEKKYRFNKTVFERIKPININQ